MKKQNTPIIVDVEAGKTYAWCVCGESKTFPACDGSHGSSGKVPLVQKMTQSAKVAVCACGKSDNIFCNGNHKNITE